MSRERDASQNQDEPPVRLRDAVGAGLPSGLGDALGGASARHQPSGAQLGELRRSLGAVLAQPAATGAGSGSAAATTHVGTWPGVLVVAVLAAGGAGLWYGLSSPGVEPPAVTAPATAPPAPAPPAPPAPAAPVTTPAASAQPAPAVTATATGELPAIDPGRRRGALGRGDRQADELRLLSRAQQMLVSEPALALLMTERHLRQFPEGTLVQEREVIAIEALRALQKTDDANERARRFRARYPSSAHLPRVEGQRL